MRMLFYLASKYAGYNFRSIDAHVSDLISHAYAHRYLVYGMNDKGGDGVRTAQELVALAGQAPMLEFPRIIAKGCLHDNIKAEEVREAIEASHSTICHIFLPNLWALVVQYSKMPHGTKLQEQPHLRPLYNIVHRFGYALPISNFYSETLIKTLLKTLHHTQRQHAATASRWLAALHRDPKCLYPLTQELVEWARKLLGHNLESRVKPRPAVEDVPTTESILGLHHVIDVPIPSGGATSEVSDDSSDDEDGGIACEGCGHVGGDKKMLLCDGCNKGYHTDCLIPPLVSIPSSPTWLCPTCTALGVITVPVEEASTLRRQLMTGAIIAVEWKPKDKDQSQCIQIKLFLLAQVVTLPNSATARSFKVKWLQETDEDGVYVLNKKARISTAHLADIIDIAPRIECLLCAGACTGVHPTDGRWRLIGPPRATSTVAKKVAPSNAAKSKAKATAAVTKATKPKADAAKPRKPKVGAAKKNSSSDAAKSAPATSHDRAASVMYRAAGKLGWWDRPILTKSNTAWLNGCQVGMPDHCSMPTCRIGVYAADRERQCADVDYALCAGSLPVSTQPAACGADLHKDEPSQENTQHSCHTDGPASLCDSSRAVLHRYRCEAFLCAHPSPRVPNRRSLARAVYLLRGPSGLPLRWLRQCAQ